MTFLSVSPVLAWFVLGIVFYAVELAVPGFIVFFFGLGCWCVALAVFFIPALSLSSQLLLFLATSIATLFLLRSFLRRIFHGKATDSDVSATEVPAGSTGVVTEAIVPPAEGRVKFGGSFWRASADRSIQAGAVVRIIEKKNLSVKVCLAEAEGES